MHLPCRDGFETFRLRQTEWNQGRTEKDRRKSSDVETRVELRAGEPFVRLRVSFDNPCRDHRVRIHLPLPAVATGSAAEGQFAVVERGLSAEGGYGETAVPTFPARGFVAAGGIAALLEHVVEYEVVDGAELALTVLRSTGLISRNENPWREDPAGPEIAVPGAQLLGGPRSLSFALMPFEGSWSDAGVLAQMERFQHPFPTEPGTGAVGRAAEETGLAVDGDGVTLSSLRLRNGWLELRLVCQSPRAAHAVVHGRFGEARTADLRGNPDETLAVAGGELALELEPWEIRTVQLR